MIGIPITGYINESAGSRKAGIFFSFASVVFGSTLLFLMECFRSHNYAMGMRHNELCKMDTNMTTSSDVNDNNVDQRHSHDRRRPSDLGSVTDVGSNHVDVRLAPSVVGNGMIDELAHLQCTCEHINGKVFSLAANDDIGKVEREASKQVDDVAVLEEEDVVLEDEELEKVDDDEDDDDGEEGDHFVPRPIIFEEDEEEEEDDDFVKMTEQVKHFENITY